MVAAYLDGMQTWDGPGKQVVWFGECELDSPAEWNLLLGNTIFLQLRALYSLVERYQWESTHTRIKGEDPYFDTELVR